MISAQQAAAYYDNKKASYPKIDSYLSIWWTSCQKWKKS